MGEQVNNVNISHRYRGQFYFDPENGNLSRNQLNKLNLLEIVIDFYSSANSVHLNHRGDIYSLAWDSLKWPIKQRRRLLR